MSQMAMPMMRQQMAAPMADHFMMQNSMPMAMDYARNERAYAKSSTTNYYGGGGYGGGNWTSPVPYNVDSFWASEL